MCDFCLVLTCANRIQDEFSKARGEELFLFIVVDLNNKSVNHRPLG